MKKITMTTIAAMLLGASGLFAQTSAYTKPSGFVTHTLKAGQFNLIGLTLHNAVTVTGSFSAVSGTTLTDSNVDFTTALTAGKTYILEITSGALTGTIQEVTSWTATTLTTPDDLAADGLLMGDKYQLREAMTLADVFGLDNSAGLPSTGGSGTSGIVWVQDDFEPSGFAKYYYKASIFGQPAGWKRLTGDGSTEEDAEADSVTLLYADALYVQMPSGDSDVSLVLAGSVKMTSTSIALPGTFNRIAVVYPVGSTLQNSGLEAQLESSGSSGTSDNVYIQQADGSYKIYYYKASIFGQPAGWKEIVNGDQEVDAPLEVPLASGIIIQQVGDVKNIKLSPAYSE